MTCMITQGTLRIKPQWLPKGHVRPQAESGWLPGCQASTETEIIKLTSNSQHRPVPTADVSQMNDLRVNEYLHSSVSASLFHTNGCFFFLLDNSR